MEGGTSAGGSSSQGRGRGTALAAQALQRSLLESIYSPVTYEVTRGRGCRTKKTGRGGKAGGGRGRGRRTAAASSSPPPADSPEHRVDPFSDTPVDQHTPVVVEEEATSTRTTWSPWPDQPE